MRADVQEIFKMTPHDKQVMMFSATLSKEIRPVCKKFMNDVSYHNSPSPTPAGATVTHSRRLRMHSIMRGRAEGAARCFGVAAAPGWWRRGA